VQDSSSDPRALEIEALVRRGHESPDVDAKGPGSWKVWSKAEKAELVRDMMAMANSDRPGWILLGISEGTAGEWVYDGLTDAQSASFDPSDIGKKVKRLADPEVQFSVHRLEVDSRRYAAIRATPFQTMPHICKTSSGTVVEEGTIYIRTEACETTRVTTAEQMRRLVERAIQMHADSIVGRIAELIAQAGLGAVTQAPEPEVEWASQIEEARREAGKP
jgi:predicted HTH transcriptional regulator